MADSPGRFDVRSILLAMAMVCQEMTKSVVTVTRIEAGDRRDWLEPTVLPKSRCDRLCR